MDGREQENTVVSLQRDEFVMIQADAELFHFHFFYHGLFVEQITLSVSFPPSVWELSGAWSTAEVLFMLFYSHHSMKVVRFDN